MKKCTLLLAIAVTMAGCATRPAQRGCGDEQFDAFLPRYPLGRLNTSEDVANACLWLCTDEAFLTGQNIQPNGGLTLRGNPQAGDIERSVGAAMAKLQGGS